MLSNRNPASTLRSVSTDSAPVSRDCSCVCTFICSTLKQYEISSSAVPNRHCSSTFLRDGGFSCGLWKRIRASNRCHMSHSNHILSRRIRILSHYSLLMIRFIPLRRICTCISDVQQFACTLRHGASDTRHQSCHQLWQSAPKSGSSPSHMCPGSSIGISSAWSCEPCEFVSLVSVTDFSAEEPTNSTCFIEHSPQTSILYWHHASHYHSMTSSTIRIPRRLLRLTDGLSISHHPPSVGHTSRRHLPKGVSSLAQSSTAAVRRTGSTVVAWTAGTYSERGASFSWGTAKFPQRVSIEITSSTIYTDASSIASSVPEATSPWLRELLTSPLGPRSRRLYLRSTSLCRCSSPRHRRFYGDSGARSHVWRCVFRLS